MSEPRHFTNKLKPVPPDDEGLAKNLADFQENIASSVKLLLQHVSRENRVASRDSLYIGDSGIALMFLRLGVQFEAAGLEDCLGSDIRAQIPEIISKLLPVLTAHQVRPGHLSPLDSSVGSAVVYMFAFLYSSSAGAGKSASNYLTIEDKYWIAALKTLQNAVVCAVEDDELGSDEVLYGRAGLLWAMLNLHRWVVPPPRREAIARIVNTRSIEQVLERILEAGRLGAQLYAKEHGEVALPLMWPWHDKFYLGAIHGVAGILTVLLQAPRDIILPRMRIITECISALCNITYQMDGHLPSSLPEKPRTHNYVQICHGSPGLLLLLATFRKRFPTEWNEEWEAAEALALEKVWDEGLVRKGIGICHGVSGNAWTLLLEGRVNRKVKEGDALLSRSLAFLFQATELPPLVPRETSPFRTPDHPLSLFEGLAGAVCAWIDACVIIRERLGGVSASKKLVLGLPGLGGTGAHGYL